MIAWSAFGASDVGLVRKRNEDSVRLDLNRGVFVVADGMGGHAAGEVASALAADTIVELLAGETPVDEQNFAVLLASSFAEAQRRIVECCRGDVRFGGMGTTLTVALVQPDGKLQFGHLGDSRLYRLHQGSLVQLTRDHTWTQHEVDAGRIAPEAARNHPFAHILTRVLTADEPADPDVHIGQVAPGDALLLCSDGLHNMLEPQILLEILMQPAPPAQIVARLIEAANQRGGADNITAIVIQIRES